MGISKEWKNDRDLDRWSVAQIDASFHDVVETLAKSRSYRSSVLSDDAMTYVIQGALAIVVFSTSESNWTYIECPLSHIDQKAIVRLTRGLQTQAVFAGLEGNVGSIGYQHIQRGKPIEEFWVGDPAFEELTHEQFLKRGWLVNKSQWIRFKTNRKIDVASSLLTFSLDGRTWQIA